MLRFGKCVLSLRLWLPLSAAMFLLLAASASAEVVIDWVTVGDPGNTPCDTQVQGCFGAVAYKYRIGKFEVTNAQYTEFLDAVAATDTHLLYNTNMGVLGGITQSGSPGSYTYSAIAGREDMPVNFVSIWDAIRFANWLHNGQPTGLQDNTTTEDGAYTLTSTNPETVARNAKGVVFLTSENEWYKAAYYKGGGTSAGYWDYPAGSDVQVLCIAPVPSANTANCDSAVGDLTNVGSYTGAASPAGTFDQGGNVWEWNETSTFLRIRGGTFGQSPGLLNASAGALSSVEDEVVGFRVASPVTPLPSISLEGLALLLGLLLSTGLFGLGLRHRRRT